MFHVRHQHQLPASCQRAISAQTSNTSKQRGRSRKTPISLECSPIEAILWPTISRCWPEARREYKALPNRKFLVDIAFPEQLLAIEADGWQYHGKFLRDHQRDRERSNLLVLHGWRILHYTAKDIHQNLEGIIRQVEQAMSFHGRRSAGF